MHMKMCIHYSLLQRLVIYKVCLCFIVFQDVYCLCFIVLYCVVTYSCQFCGDHFFMDSFKFLIHDNIRIKFYIHGV